MIFIGPFALIAVQFCEIMLVLNLRASVVKMALYATEQRVFIMRVYSLFRKCRSAKKLLTF
jgi:hypothetical protein